MHCSTPTIRTLSFSVISFIRALGWVATVVWSGTVRQTDGGVPAASMKVSSTEFKFSFATALPPGYTSFSKSHPQCRVFAQCDASLTPRTDTTMVCV